jgi:hypothetical protein
MYVESLQGQIAAPALVSSSAGSPRYHRDVADLTGREMEVLEALVKLAETMDDAAFDISPGADRLDLPAWPKDGLGPSREEVRSLVGRGFLDVDKNAAPAWRFWPSEEARALFGSDSEQALARALKDPDQRLGIILEAIVDAFEADPSVPLLMLRTNGPDIIRHPNWGIPADVARLHDLRQLEELGLIGWEGDTEFYPTPSGRTAVRNPATFLSQRAEQTEDEEERSRLRGWVEKFRAGDVAVGAAGGLTGAAIRATLGL